MTCLNKIPLDLCIRQYIFRLIENKNIKQTQRPNNSKLAKSDQRLGNILSTY